MTTITDIRNSGAEVSQISRPLYEPIAAPTSLRNRLGRFGEHYDLNNSSYLYRYLSALCGEAGAGLVKRELLLPRLQSALESTNFSDLDRLYGNPIALPRISAEVYDVDPKNEALTEAQWQEVRTKDASYRARCLLWMRAIIAGSTPTGIKLAAEAACGVECDILEYYQVLDNERSPIPTEFPSALGYNVIGASTVAMTSNRLDAVGAFFLDHTSYCKEAKAYVAGGANTAKLRVAVYADTSGIFEHLWGTGRWGTGLPWGRGGPIPITGTSPNTLIAVSKEITLAPSAAASWVSIPFITTLTLPPGSYWLAFWWGSNSGIMYYTSTPSVDQYMAQTYSSTGTPVATWPGLGTVTDKLYSLYLSMNSIADFGVTGSRNEFVIMPRTDALSQEEHRRINRLVDRIRPVNTFCSIYIADPKRTEQAVRTVTASSEGYYVQRFVTGRSDINWPPVDPAQGLWVTTDEEEARKFAYVDRQEAVTFISIHSASASSEQVGPFAKDQQDLFGHLKKDIDSIYVYSSDKSYAKAIAPLQLSIPWMSNGT
jgi:hypothetical protein